MKLRNKIATVLAATAMVAGLGMSAASASTSAPAHVTTNSVSAGVEKPAQTEGVLSNTFGDAKYNSSSGTWREADGGTYTDILIVNQGSYYTMQNETTGDWLEVAGNGSINETSDSSLARAHWVHAGSGCNPGWVWNNVYADSNSLYTALSGGTPGTYLWLADLGGGNDQCEDSSAIWQFSGTY